MPSLLQDIRRQRPLLAAFGSAHLSPSPADAIGVPGTARLSYGSDGGLREGARLIADLTTGSDGSYGRVTAFGRPYEIMRRGADGWVFRLDDVESEACLCEYVPFRIGRGGYV